MDTTPLIQITPMVQSAVIASQDAMSSAWTLKDIISGIGITVIAGALLYIGRKLQILDDLKKTVDKIKTNVKVVSDFLISSELPFDSNMLQNYSPIQLTGPGKDYLKTIGFMDLFNTHAGDFYSCIEKETPTTDYDIENASIRCVLQLFNKEYFRPIKDHFYNNPKEDKGSFIRVAGIYVRDRYMERSSQASKTDERDRGN